MVYLSKHMDKLRQILSPNPSSVRRQGIKDIAKYRSQARRDTLNTAVVLIRLV